MSQSIKIETDSRFFSKIEDDNNLKCGEIVLSNNTHFCIVCTFCQRVCNKIQDFFCHVLYDHLNYIGDYEFSENDEYSVQKILEPSRLKTSYDNPEFIDVNDDETSTRIEKIDFVQNFESYVTSDITPCSFVKTEIEDEDNDELDYPVDFEQMSSFRSSGSPVEQSSPQDILHIEIMEAPSGSDYEIENTTSPHPNENSNHAINYDDSDQHNAISNDDEEENNTSEPHENSNNNESEDEDDSENVAVKSKRSAKETVHKCPHCTKIFTTKANVNRHIGNVHHQYLNNLSCDTCSKPFRNETQLQLHVKRHMGVKPHSCEICGSRFSDKSNLNVHILRHKGIKPHKCTLCEKRFHSTTERKLHIRSHTGERPFVCEVCGRKFSNSGHLCSHRRRHLNDKRFECDYCHKRFFDRKLLNDHKVMHTDERPFACDLCGATFQRKKALMQHEKLHSGVKEYICKLCGKSFAQNAGLYSHMKYH